LNALVQLYKALGGGWQSVADEQTGDAPNAVQAEPSAAR
jgi:hypothetical protein